MSSADDRNSSSSDEKVILTKEQALSMLPDGDRIHTFRSAFGGVLIGCDWDRDKLEQEIREKQCEVGGSQCQAMNHGLVVWTSETEPLFVECRTGIDYEAFDTVSSNSTAEKDDSNE